MPSRALGKRVAVVQAWLEAMPGTSAEPFLAPRGATPSAIIYKVMGRMFAILALRGAQSVILKCDPHLAVMLRERYAGIGHRSHLDRRYWINVSLETDVPTKEIKRLVAQSYQSVCANLTRKQRADLAALAS
jgi:predicted DNA-binding protein (MmcQ/YjbR family)